MYLSLDLALTCSALSKHIGQVTSRAVLTAVVSSFSLFSLVGLLWNHTNTCSVMANNNQTLVTFLSLHH